MINLDSERGNFKLFGLIYWLYLRKFELFGARLLKKRVNMRGVHTRGKWNTLRTGPKMTQGLF